MRLALFGRPGAGKSTTSGMLQLVLNQAGRNVAVVKLAAPLYDIQAAFYQRCGVELRAGQQDGALLNFLGAHVRTTAATFLVDDFARRCRSAQLLGARAIVCDDARPVDLPALRAQGFRTVRISAPPEVRVARRRQRGDRTLGDDAHSTEAGVEEAITDYELINAGSLDELRDQIRMLGRALLDGSASATLPDQSTAIQAERDLIEHATRALRARYREARHQIAAALLASDGQVFVGLHVEATIGRASICAEASALSQARLAGAEDLRVAVAVRHPKSSEVAQAPRVVPPCGLCRELLLDYAPDLRILLPAGASVTSVLLRDLLPHKYIGTKWAGESARAGQEARPRDQ